VSLILYEVLLLVCASDLANYVTILCGVLWVFLAAGAARLISVTLYGVPPPLVLDLLILELLVPPVLLSWHPSLEHLGSYSLIIT